MIHAPSMYETMRYGHRRKRHAAPPPSWTGGFMPGPVATPAPTTPPVAGYSLWLDATYTSNTNSEWKDQSGNNYHAVITNSGGTLELGTGINGLQCYIGTLTGANASYMATPAYPVGPAFTAMAVYQLSATAGVTQGRQGLISANYAAG